MQMPTFFARSLPKLFILAVIYCRPAAATESLVFDVGVSGTSEIEECLLHGSCIQYPVIGRIGLALEATRPRLRNIDSLLVEPLGGPSPASGFAWNFLQYTIGDYLSDPTLPDVSMRFFPSPIIDPPGLLFSFDVQLSEGQSKLTFSGGIDGLATFPMEVDSIDFSVEGRLVPEPGGASLAVLAVINTLASRRVLRIRRRRARAAP